MKEETKAATDFGADVFGDEAIRTYLSKDTAKKLQATFRLVCTAAVVNSVSI